MLTKITDSALELRMNGFSSGKKQKNKTLKTEIEKKIIIIELLSKHTVVNGFIWENHSGLPLFYNVVDLLFILDVWMVLKWTLVINIFSFLDFTFVWALEQKRKCKLLFIFFNIQIARITAKIK